MINLDDKEALLKIQGGDAVLSSVEALPQQLKQSFEEAQQVNFPEEFKNVKNIVVCGMGGSRFPAYILKELFKKQLTIPYLLNDDYNLPAFVNSETLVILSSYSGTTEEVIANGKAALAKGAKLTGVTAGGEVATFLKDNNFPVYVFNPIHNPSGQPRIGFGYAVGGHLGLLIKLGVIKIAPAEVTSAIIKATQLFEEFRLDVPKEKNPAKQMAEQLYQRYPYYIVSEFLTGVGNAIANQTNETAKVISSFRIIPELNHHLMEGLKFPDKFRDLATFVFFFSKLYSAPIQKRFQITKEVVEQNKVQTLWYELKGTAPIEQAFELMGFGSYLSMYLSALYRQDPSAIPFVDYFKNKLRSEV